MEVAWRDQCAVCVVCASSGYPGKYEKGKEITGLKAATVDENVIVFHAGTRRMGRRYLTDGGRVLAVTGLGATHLEARDHAYRAVGAIDFDGMYFRTDIAARVAGGE